MPTSKEDLDEQAQLESLTVYEQRRWYCCFSWHRPMLHSAWTAGDTLEGVAKGKRPSTRAYRKALSQSKDAPREWDWSILINEHTDKDGWQYARCFWIRFRHVRIGAFGRTDERKLDFVKRRQWVHKDQAEILRRSAKRGTLQLMTPAQMAEARQEAQRKWDEGMAEMWSLLAQLDETTDFKSLASALLDPVALQKVARVHRKAMKELKDQALNGQEPQHLPQAEQWNTGLVGAVVGLAGLAHDGPARRLGRFFKGGIQDLVDTTDHLVQRVLQKQTSSPLRPRQGSAVVTRPRGHSVASAGMSSGVSQPPQPEREHAASAAAVPPASAPDEPRPDAAAEAQGVDTTQPPTPLTPPLAAVRPAIVRFSLGSRKLQASPDIPALRVSSSHLSSAAAAAATRELPAHNTPATAAAWPGANAHVTMSRSTSLPTSASRGREGQHHPHQHHHRQPHGMGGLPRLGSGRFASTVSSVIKALHITRADDKHTGDSILPVPKRMVLSCAELECAMGHALGIYGDIETYIGSYPMQSYYAAICKFSGVPEQDVLMAVWRSQTFEPAHYVAIDRGRRKIVICVRGTMELVDGLTDVVGRPEPVAFGPGLDGCAHAGILRAARFIVNSVRGAVAEAVYKQPGYNIFVTGHSLGGGTAALVAMMLRHDPMIPAPMRQKLRGVCLAPAAVADAQLAAGCQDFVAAVVYNTDVVPRVDIYSAAKFVNQVAQASPLKRTLLTLYRAMGISGGKKAAKKAATDAASKGGAGEQVLGAVTAAADKVTGAVSGAADAMLGTMGGLFGGQLSGPDLRRLSSTNATQMLQHEAALRAALVDLDAVVAGGGTDPAAAATVAADIDMMTDAEVALAGATSEGRSAAAEAARAVRSALDMIARYKQLVLSPLGLQGSVAVADATGAQGAAAAASDVAGTDGAQVSASASPAAGTAVAGADEAGTAGAAGQAEPLPDKQALLQELAGQVSVAAIALQSFAQSLHSRAKAAVRPAAAAAAAAAAASFSQAGRAEGGQTPAYASAQAVYAAGPVAEASETDAAADCTADGTVAASSHQEAAPGDDAAQTISTLAGGPLPVAEAPLAAQPHAAFAVSPQLVPATPASATSASPAAQPPALDDARPSKTVPPAADDARPSKTAANPQASDKLLHPLLPAGTLYWLLPDTRVTSLIQHSNQGNVGMKGWKAITGSRSSGLEAPAPRSGASTTSGPCADTGLAPAGPASDHKQAAKPSAGAAAGVSISTALHQKGDAHMDRARATLGGFLGDLQDGLEAGEQLASDMGADKGEEAVVLPEDGEQLALLQVEAVVFQEMFFFKQALADHVPLAYLKAIRRYLRQERDRPVWERLGSIRL